MLRIMKVRVIVAVVTISSLVCSGIAAGQAPQNPTKSSSQLKTQASAEQKPDLQSETRSLKDPAIAKLVSGFQRTVLSLRYICNALERTLLDDAGGAEDYLNQAHANMRGKPAPRFYVLKLQGLLRSRSIAQRRDAVIALGQLAESLEHGCEWDPLNSPALLKVIRGMVKQDVDKTVRSHAAITLEQFEAADRKWETEQ